MAMIDLIAQNLAPIMFAVVMGLLLLGYPVAFTLAAGGIAFFAIGVGFSAITPDHVHLSWTLMQAQPDRVFGILSNDTLLAVPFFTLMGAIFQRTGIAEDLLSAVAELFGPVRGGLSFAVVLVGALLAATTGVVSASVMTMGLIALPIMMRTKYHPQVAAGTVTAAGTLSQIVPPSLVLIVMADQVGRPVGEMYKGALVPSALMIGLYMALIAALAIMFPRLMPAMGGTRVAGRDYASLGVMAGIGALAGWAGGAFFKMAFSPEGALVATVALGAVVALVLAWADAHAERYSTALSRKVIFAAVPTLGLIFLVLGTIFLGIATPTESGSLGAVGAMLLALIRGRLPMAELRQALEQTARLTVFVYFILIGARVFSLTFYGLGGDEWLHRLLLALPGERAGFIIFSMVIIFVLGCFLDFFEIAFIVVPLLLPTAVALDIDPLWFGILISMNLQTSFLTPPFGFALFYLRSVAPLPGKAEHGMRTSDIYTGPAPFILINVFVIALVAIFPALVEPGRQVAKPGGTIEINIPAPADPPGSSKSLNHLFE